MLIFFLPFQLNFVTRFLFFVDSKEVSLKFIDQPDKTIDFFNQLEASGASRSTVLNYMDSIQKFVRYISSEDPSSQPATSRFVDLLNETRQKIHKKAAKARKEMG